MDAIEKCVDVCVDEPGVAFEEVLTDLPDGHADAAAAAVAEAGFVELAFEEGFEVSGDGGLEDAVLDGGDEEGALFRGAGALFDEDAAEGPGPVGLVEDGGLEGGEVRFEVVVEFSEGDGVCAGATVVGAVVEVGGAEGGDGEEGGHGKITPIRKPEPAFTFPLR